MPTKTIVCSMCALRMLKKTTRKRRRVCSDHLMASCLCRSNCIDWNCKYKTSVIQAVWPLRTPHKPTDLDLSWLCSPWDTFRMSFLPRTGTWFECLDRTKLTTRLSKANIFVYSDRRKHWTSAQVPSRYRHQCKHRWPRNTCAFWYQYLTTRLLIKSASSESSF